MKKIMDGLVDFMSKYMPSSYFIAVVLAICTFIAGVAFTDTTFLGMVKILGDGMWGLLAFSMQIALTLFTSYVFADAPIVQKTLKRVARLAKNRVQAVLLVSFASLVCTYINWGLGLVAGALLAKEVAAVNQGKKVPYALLCAAAFSGNLMRGPSSNVFLGPSSPGNIVEQFVGVIPLSETLYSVENLILTVVLFIAIPLVFWFMMPAPDKSVELVLSQAEIDAMNAELTAKKEKIDKSSMCLADRLEYCWLPQIIIAVLLAISLVLYFAAQTTFNININTLNLLFLVLGLLAHGTPKSYCAAAKKAVKSCDGIVLQFPFYAAIMVMLRDTGMATSIAYFFVDISTKKTLPFFSFLTAAIINFFIPSGGGLWSVQGPIMMEAAQAMGADPAAVLVGMGWGDSWTGQIQPFWALPLLSIAGLEVKDIMGYCFWIMVLSGIFITATLFIM